MIGFGFLTNIECLFCGERLVLIDKVLFTCSFLHISIQMQKANKMKVPAKKEIPENSHLPEGLSHIFRTRRPSNYALHTDEKIANTLPTLRIG